MATKKSDHPLIKKKQTTSISETQESQRFCWDRLIKGSPRHLQSGFLDTVVEVFCETKPHLQLDGAGP